MRDAREILLQIGDTELAVCEWPGNASATVLLLHATGFHARCWQQVVELLPGHRVLAADLRFHGRSGSVGEVDWELMSRDMVALVETLGLHDVVGAGHSIGGYLLARAGAALPDRFRRLVLIDPVITAPETYQMAREVAAQLDAGDHPVARRKNRWRDAEEMFQRFRDRPPFDSWQEQVLRDYCDYALHPADEEGYRQLLCDPLNEAMVYLTQAYSDVILEELPRLTMPVSLLRAEYKGVDMTDLSGSPTWPGLAAALPDCEDIYLPQCNHFIPMQDPALVADCIARACLTSSVRG